MEKTRLLIIGGGPAGYTAGIYASRAGLAPVLFEGPEPGGQLTTTTLVENYPGFAKGIDSLSLTSAMREQAVNVGTDIRRGIITKADLSKRPFSFEIDGSQAIEADAVIIATGATAKYLGLPSERKYRGMGVSACATCDGFFYRKKDVAVVGGGDTACEEATYLAGICNKVYMIVRRDELRASKAMQQRVMENPKIEVLWNCNTKEVLGNEMDGVTGARLLNNKTNEEKVIDISGFLVAIGHTPNTKVFAKYIDLDEKGYIKTIPGTAKTNVPGVFACGDVQDPNYRQAITAAGSGCKAAIDAEHFLLEY